MALLPTGYVVSCRGTGVPPLEQLGGCAMMITDATTVTTGSPFTQTLNLKDTVTNSTMSTRRNRVIELAELTMLIVPKKHWPLVLLRTIQTPS